jgi:hypothetical protein
MNLAIEDVALRCNSLCGLAAQIKFAPGIACRRETIRPPLLDRRACYYCIASRRMALPMMKRVNGLTQGGSRCRAARRKRANRSARRHCAKRAGIGAGCTSGRAGPHTTIYIPPSNFLVTPTVGGRSSP